MNLINQILGEFRGDTLNSVSSALGESPAKTQTALGAAVPALVGGLANRATNTGDANAMLDLIRGQHFDSGQYADAASAVKGPSGLTRLIDTGRPLLDSVFGNRTGSVADWVSSLGGVSKSSASSLLGLALPVVLGQVGRQVKSAGWTSANLMSLLAGQRTFLQEAPAGLAGILSGDDNAPRVAAYETVHPEPVVGSYERHGRAPVVGSYQTQARRGFNWLWLLPLLLIPLLWFALARRGPAREATVVQPAAPAAPRVETRAPVTAPISVAALGPMIEKRLPNGVTIRIPTNGVESKLITFIEDPTRPAATETWMSFDRLQFDNDSATLAPASNEQLRNVAEILKAYPNVKAKIGGYTDNVADDAYNMKLSQERATNTMNPIAALDVAPTRLEAEGYGENNPIADNSTAEGRQRNRRVDIRVTDK